MELFFIYVLPMLVIWAMIWYARKHLKTYPDRIVRLLLIVLSLIPGVSLILAIVIPIIIVLGSTCGIIEKPEIKDTKLNRWLFESEAKKWDKK